jgi:hypothetical protein
MDISRLNILFKEEFENGYGKIMTMVVDDRNNMYVHHEDNGGDYMALKDFQNIIIDDVEQDALMEFIQKHVCDD